MTGPRLALFSAAVFAAMGVPSTLCAGLLTVDEAVSISQETGRPIFAVAGSAT